MIDDAALAARESMRRGDAREKGPRAASSFAGQRDAAARLPNAPKDRFLLVAAVAVGFGFFAVYPMSMGLLSPAIVVAIPLVLCLAVVVSLRWLALALIVSTLLSGVRFEFAGFWFLPEHGLLVPFGAALVIRSTAAVLRRAASYELLLLAWILWNLAVSLVYSPDKAKSVAIVGWMGVAWLILWCVRGFFLTDPIGRARVLRTGARFAAVMGAVSFLLWILALQAGWRIGVQPEFNTGALAAKGLALEANFLGIQEMCWLFLAIRATIARERPVSRWELAGMTLGIVSSMTRSAWLATILIVAGTAAASRLTPTSKHHHTLHRSLRLPHGAVAGLMVMALVLGFATPAGEKFRSALNFGSDTGAARVTNWTTAWEDMADSGAYLTGLGTNSFGQRHMSPTIRDEPDYLGNLPLMVLYDSGVIGLLLFATALVSLVLVGRDAAARLLNLVFVLALLIVGAATSPVWFGFIWVTVAALDSGPRERQQPTRLRLDALAS